MQPHQQRVIDEQFELDQKLEKLTAFFKTQIFSDLDIEEQCRLRAQAYHMNEYSKTLGERISKFN